VPLIGHFLVAFCLSFKTSPLAKPFLSNEFDWHENELIDETLFQNNGFAQQWF